MKVKRMEVVPLVLPIEYPFYEQGVSMDKLYPVIVRLYTDEGLDSFGTCFTFNRPRSLVACIEDLRDLVVGADIMRFENLWHKIFQATKSMGHQGYPVFALSAIDTAIWGLRAAVAGVPLAHLLGGFRDRIPAYAGFLLWKHLSIDELQKRGNLLVEQGFRMAKLRMGGKSVEEEKARVRALREAVGKDVDILVDANWSWSVPQAIQFGRMLEEENVYWLEDPLSNEDPSQLGVVAAALDMPVATGENFCTKFEFRNLIEKQSGDILIIDLQRVGGVTEWMKVAALAESWNLPVVNHIFSELSVHLATAVPNCLCLEYMPWLREIFANPPELKEGCLCVPSRPGLGMELDPQVISKYKLT
jgi:L-alanine-DL-glutamate epimerase-like enolase superfamily enzyme